MKFKSFISYLIITFIFITGSILTSNAQVTNWTNYNNRNSNNTYLIINSKKNKMAYYKDNKFVREFDVATGKKTTPTPQGKFKIVNKIVNRPYYSGGIDGGDPKNPLGDRRLGLYVNGTYGTNYGIHGNNNESSIGNHVSGGCIRMHNAEIRWLFDQIEIGSEAIIKYTYDSYEDIAKSYNI